MPAADQCAIRDGRDVGHVQVARLRSVESPDFIHRKIIHPQGIGCSETAVSSISGPRLLSCKASDA